MLSICKFSLKKKYNMLKADENGPVLFFYNEFLLYIFNANGIEKPEICWQKFLPLSIQ